MNNIEEMETEVKFIDVIKNMQNELKDPTQFIEISLPMDSRILGKDDEITMTEDGFISINNKDMYNLSFVASASMIEMIEKKKKTSLIMDNID